MQLVATDGYPAFMLGLPPTHMKRHQLTQLSPYLGDTMPKQGIAKLCFALGKGILSQSHSFLVLRRSLKGLIFWDRLRENLLK